MKDSYIRKLKIKIKEKEACKLQMMHEDVKKHRLTEMESNPKNNDFNQM
jgi:hypothetical protein